MIPGFQRSPGEGKGYPVQYAGLKNSMDFIIYGVTKSWTRLRAFISGTMQVEGPTEADHDCQKLWLYRGITRLFYLAEVVLPM